LPALKCVNRICISGRHGLPAAMIACQQSAPTNATTTIRRIRPRVSRPGALSSWEVSQSGSLMRNYSDARSEPTSPDIDKDFLNPSFSCRCSQMPEAPSASRETRGPCRRAGLVATTAVPVLLKPMPGMRWGRSTCSATRGRAAYRLLGVLRATQVRVLNEIRRGGRQNRNPNTSTPLRSGVDVPV
jgi:hypothetical protein